MISTSLFFLIPLPPPHLHPSFSASPILNPSFSVLPLFNPSLSAPPTFHLFFSAPSLPLIITNATPLFPFHPVSECRRKELRLVGGAMRSEGTVQMCVSHNWSAVCDHSWGSMAASVVCRQLGASQGIVSWTPNSGPRLLDTLGIPFILPT